MPAAIYVHTNALVASEVEWNVSSVGRSRQSGSRCQGRPTAIRSGCRANVNSQSKCGRSMELQLRALVADVRGLARRYICKERNPNLKGAEH